MGMSEAIFADGWEVAGSDDILQYWLKGKDGASTEKPPKVDISSHAWQAQLQDGDIWSWTMQERKQAYATWRDRMTSELIKDLMDAQRRYSELLDEMNGVRDGADVEVLRNAQVIGMTTTGVVKHRHKIAAVSPKALICEEAGEVLEAQLMACLTQSCQQMISIGDHQQLRPHIAVYDLSVESKRGQQYRLDVSMFERLVSTTNGGGGAPWWTLTQQHWMRPEISQFVRTLFYPRLRDAEETKTYSSIKGVDKNVFFVSHTYPEDGAAGVRSSSSSRRRFARTRTRSKSSTSSGCCAT